MFGLELSQVQAHIRCVTSVLCSCVCNNYIMGK